MECPTASTLVEHARGHTSPGTRAAIEAHMATCEACRRTLTALGHDALESRTTAPITTAPLARGEERADCELGPGDTAGRYEIRRRLGAGGMGVVYEAHDPILDRKLAVKVLRREAWAATEEMRARLLLEAQALARLTHPNVVAVHDVGRLGDQLFIVMDLVDGCTIDEWLGEARRGWRDVLDLYLRAGAGLAAAHHVGLVHRDFKPANVLVGRDGRVCVTDFGLVRVVGPRSARPDALPDAGVAVDGITRDGAVMGSPGYMAPEQMLGGEIGAACDVFSFSVSLFEALYGERPFRGKTLAELCAAIAAGQIAEPPPDVQIPRWLRANILAGLAAAAEARPAMRALLEDLERERAVHGLARAEKLLEEAGAVARASGGDAEFVRVAARLLRDFVEPGAHGDRQPDAARAPTAPADQSLETDEIGPQAPILAEVEMLGAHAQAMLGKLGYQALASHFMLREGLGILHADGTTGFDPDAWYPALPFVRAAHGLVSEVGPRASFHTGLFTQDRERAREGGRPLAGVGAALRELDATYHLAFRLRGRPLVDEKGEPLPGIGRYLCQERGPTEITLTATGPWPCEFDRDIVTGVALRHQHDATVEHGAADACRKRGDRRCAYRVRWPSPADPAVLHLRAAADVADFVREPLASYLTGKTFVYWYADPHLDGAIFHGSPAADELQLLIRVWDALANERVTHGTLIDLRRVVEIPTDTYGVLANLLRGRREAHGRRIKAMALLRPAAMPGALITGVLQMERVLHPFEFFDDEAAALAWLGRPDPALAAALGALGRTL